MKRALNFPQESPDFNVALAMSLVIFGFDGEELQVLTVTSNQDPFNGKKMLPSKYLKASDDFDHAAKRLFNSMFKKQQEVSIEQLRAFGEISRNPAGRVVNIGYYALAKKVNFLDSKWKELDFNWFPLGEIPELGLDHNKIIRYAEERLKRRVSRRPVGFHLLPEEFTLSQLQAVYEQSLKKEFDKRNFRKKLNKTSLIIELDAYSNGRKKGQKKGSKLYKFNTNKYKKMKIEGYEFRF